MHTLLKDVKHIIELQEIYYLDQKDKEMHKQFEQFSAVLIYKFCNGSLTDFVQQYFIQNDKPEAGWLIYQLEQFKLLFRTISQMHDLHVFHMDLKPDNLLFDSENNLCIIDLGSAQYVPEPLDDYTIITPFFDEKSRLVYPLQTTKKFSSAQVEQYDVMIVEGQSYDTYALGCCLYYMLTGQYLESPLSDNVQQYQYLIEQTGSKIADAVYQFSAQICCFRPKTSKVIEYIDEVIQQLKDETYNNNFSDPKGLVRLSGFGQKLCCDVYDFCNNLHPEYQVQRSCSQSRIKFIQEKTKWFDDQNFLQIQRMLRKERREDHLYSIHQQEFNVIHQSIKFINKKISPEHQKVQMQIQAVYQNLINLMARQMQQQRLFYFKHNDSDTIDYLKVQVSNISTDQVSQLTRYKDQKMMFKVGQQLMREKSLKDFQKNSTQDSTSLDSEKLITLSEYTDSISFMQINDCSVSYDDE